MTPTDFWIRLQIGLLSVKHLPANYERKNTKQ